MTDASKHFSDYVLRNIAGIGSDPGFLGLSNVWIRECIRHNYAQNFTWLGRPVIQVPQDIYAYQELIWAVRPDMVIETGIAHGGSLIVSASILALIDYCDAIAAGSLLDPKASKRRVVGIDIDIRPHNRAGVEGHPLSPMITMIEGSSIEQSTIDQVKKLASQHKTILVMLDSNHTHAHVLAELEAYAPLTSKGSYCVVWDTGVEDLPDGFVTDRPWGKGDNPKTAVFEYMRLLEQQGRMAHDGEALRFAYDKTIEHKLAITAAPDGFLKRL